MARTWIQVLFSVLLLQFPQAWGLDCPSDCTCSMTDKGVSADCGGSAGEPSKFSDIPKGLPKNVFSIYLAHHNVSKLSQSSFQGLDNLSELYLFANMIDTIDPETFSGLKKLRLLDLSFNLLRTFKPDHLLPLEASLQEFYLDGNLWDCTCSLLPFQKWLIKMDTKVADSKYLSCHTPEAMNRMPILQLTEKDLGC